MDRVKSLNVGYTYQPLRGGKVRCNQTKEILSSKSVRSHRRAMVNKDLDRIEGHEPRKSKKPLAKVRMTNSKGICPNRNCNKLLFSRGEPGPWQCPKCGTRYVEVIENLPASDVLRTAILRRFASLSDAANCPYCGDYNERVRYGKHRCANCGKSFMVV